MVSAASYPPLQKSQGRGTHTLEMEKEKRELRATRQSGDFSQANENHDVFVHSQAGDFGTLGIYEDERTIYINGLKKWPGTTDDTCYE